MTLDETVELVESWGSDHIQRFGGTKQGGIYLQQEPREISNLILFLQHLDLKDINYLEIGCAVGGLTYVMNKFFDIKNTVLIDDEKHRIHGQLKEVLKDVEYNKWVGDSQSEQALEYMLNLNLKFDIIFIDADHSYEGVKKDTLNYTPFLKDKGFLIFHDAEEKYTGVKLWLNEITDNQILGFKHVATFIQNPGRLGIGVYQR